MKNINERENDSQNRYVRISILDNDVYMIMKQNENDEVKFPNVKNEINSTQVSMAFSSAKRKSVNSYLATTFYTEVKGN